MAKKQKGLVCPYCEEVMHEIQVYAEGVDGWLKLGEDGEYHATPYDPEEPVFQLVCGDCDSRIDTENSHIDDETIDKLIHIHIEGKPRSSYS